MQSVKKCYVGETDAVRLKVTTWCTGKARERERARDLSGRLPDGNSLQEHKEEASGNTPPWKKKKKKIIIACKYGLFKKKTYI